MHMHMYMYRERYIHMIYIYIYIHTYSFICFIARVSDTRVLAPPNTAEAAQLPAPRVLCAGRRRRLTGMLIYICIYIYTYSPVQTVVRQMPFPKGASRLRRPAPPSRARSSRRVPR